MLNTPQLAASAPESHSGFFASIGFRSMAECRQKYKTRKGNTVGRLVAVFKRLAASLNKGQI